MSETVIEYVLRRLKDIGIDHIFGVAGDYAFPLDDAMVKHPGIEYMGCCNELNAGYAADGYARVHGIGALCNDLAPWNYAALPHALGCDGWYTTRVTTCGELDEAMKAAEQGDTAAYIEVVTDTYAAPPLAMKLHENIGSLYGAPKWGL